MTAFYDFFRKIRFLPNDVVIEADSVTDEAKFQAGVNIAFDVEDSTTSPGFTTDRVIFNAARYDTYVPNLGALPGEAAVIRLERDPLGLTGVVQTDITIESDPLSPILIDRIDANTIRIGSSSPTIPFSQEQIEDFAAQLILGGTHTEITVNYDDLGSPVTGNIDFAVTSTLQQITNRGATTTNAITISDATGSTNTSTGALRVTAGGLAVFENANIGGYVKATTLQSTVATGTAPLTVASTTVVTNLHSATADAWHTARTITLGGDLSGSVIIDGSTNVTLTATVETDKVALGTDTTGNYVAAGAVSGNGLSGSASSEGATFTVSSNATANNTAETIVFRNSLGDFAAGTITATLTGNASTATTLATGRNINGVSFNGSADITITASTTNSLTVSTGLQLDSGTTFNGGSARTISIDSTVVTTTGTQTLTNKTFTDSTTLFQDETDNTKKLAFQLSGITTGNTRTLTVPNASGTITLDGNAFFVGTTSVANNRASANLALTGISSVQFPGSTSGTVTLQPVAIAGTATITLPAITGTVVTTGDTATVSNTMLTNSSITVNGTAISLGNSGTVTANTANSVTFNDSGTGSASGTTFNGSTAITVSHNTIGAAPAAGSTNITSVGTLTTAVLSSGTGGVGYATGAGGTASQTLLKTEAVTINEPTGLITTASTLLAANTSVSFTLNNTTIAATDLVVVAHVSGGTAGSYTVTAFPASNSATITLRNITAVGLTEAPAIRFAVIKSVNA